MKALPVIKIGQTLPTLRQEQGDPLTILEITINNRLGNRVRNLKLELNGENKLIIKGCTETYYAKQLAQHAVMESGYVIAANEIEVK